MTPEEITNKLADHDRWILEMRELSESTARSNAETAAIASSTAMIANSNARSIEATANLASETRQDLARLVNIVAEFVQATNTRLANLEQS
jgi:hypothetical protein